MKFGNVILKILSVRLYKLEFIYHNCHLLQCLTGLHENTPRIFMLSLSTAYNSSTAWWPPKKGAFGLRVGISLELIKVTNNVF